MQAQIEDPAAFWSDAPVFGEERFSDGPLRSRLVNLYGAVDALRDEGLTQDGLADFTARHITTTDGAIDGWRTPVSDDWFIQGALRTIAGGWPVARDSGTTTNRTLILKIIEDGDFPIGWEGDGTGEVVKMGLEEAARELAVFWAIETWNQTFRLAISSDYFDRADAVVDTPEAPAVPAAEQLGAWALLSMFTWESDELHHA